MPLFSSKGKGKGKEKAAEESPPVQLTEGSPLEMAAGGTPGSPSRTTGDEGSSAVPAGEERSANHPATVAALSELTKVNRLSEHFNMVGAEAPLEARAEYAS
eukprot:COSAG02_NODE_29675_length_565_cov_0.778970_1_plen_102_part_00